MFILTDSSRTAMIVWSSDFKTDGKALCVCDLKSRQTVGTKHPGFTC